MLLEGVYVADLRDRLPRHPEKAYRARALDEIEQIVIHHVGAGVNRDRDAAEIARFHVSARDWPGIAYHFLVHPQGFLEYVGDLATIRYHCGKQNARSAGVCLIGDFTREQPTPRQLMRCRMLIGAIRQLTGRGLPIVGHRDLTETGYGPTSCPGATWPRWKATLG